MSCCICYESYKLDKIILKCHINHHLCKKCYNIILLSENPLCPICRKKIDDISIIYFICKIKNKCFNIFYILLQLIGIIVGMIIFYSILLQVVLMMYIF